MKELLKKVLPFLSIGRVIYRVPWSRKIFLTFDDGPNPDFTPAVLKVLKDYSVTATFFLQGSKAQSYPDLVQEIIRQGHTIANHTFSHADFSMLSPKKILQEISQCRKIIDDHYVLRPPHGGINLISMLLSIILKYKLVFWSIDSLDYQKFSSDQIINNVLQENPKQGDVILCHDKNKNIVKALPEIIENVNSKGLVWGRF